MVNSGSEGLSLCLDLELLAKESNIWLSQLARLDPEKAHLNRDRLTLLVPAHKKLYNFKQLLFKTKSLWCRPILS